MDKKNSIGKANKIGTGQKICRNKKAQVWTIDFTIGFLLFIFILLGAIVLMRDINSEDDKYIVVEREANHISASIVGEGLPTNWTNSTVVLPGITNNNRVNKTKLTEFDSLSYAQTKIMLQSTGDYVFYFYNGSAIINSTKCFRGYDMGNLCNLTLPGNAKNVAQTERLVILDSKIVKLVVIAWNTET